MFGIAKLNNLAKYTNLVNYWLMYNTGARDSNITPGGFDVDAQGNIYILDLYSSKLAKIAPTGTILWQKYVSTPAITSNHSDGGMLSLHPNGNSLLCQIQESTTSISLCQFSTTDGTILAKAVTSVAAGSTIVAGNSYVAGPDGSSNYWAFMVFKATVAGVTRAVIRRYSITTATGLMSTASATQQYSFVTGASFNDVRYSYNNITNYNHIVGYQNYFALYSGHNTLSGVTGSTRSMSGGNFQSIAAGGTASVGSVTLLRNNTLTRHTWNGSTFTKVWEKAHTVGGVGGVAYYNQQLVLDASDTAYACYWNSTTNKIIVYSVNSEGVLQWTQSLYLGGATEIDSIILKLSGSNLYLSFKYGSYAAGGMGILRIPTTGGLSKTAANGFVLAVETGSQADLTTVTLSAATPTTTAVTTGTTGSAFTLSNTTLPTYTLENI